MSARRRKPRPGKPWATNLPSVKCTVEYGGGYFVGTPEATAGWHERRKEIAAEVLKGANRRPVLRERRDEGGPCLFVGSLTGEDEHYWFYEAKGPADRMHKSNTAAHVEPCEHCPDFDGGEAS